MAFPIDAMHHMATKAARLLEENNFLRKNFNLYTKLGKRELEVLKSLALGQSAVKAAESLFISKILLILIERILDKPWDKLVF